MQINLYIHPHKNNWFVHWFRYQTYGRDSERKRKFIPPPPHKKQ